MLSRRVRIARGIVAQQFRAPDPVFRRSAIGEAIAATTSDIINMWFTNRRLNLQQRRVELAEEEFDARELARQFDQDMRTLDATMQFFGIPGEALADQPIPVQNQLEQITGQSIEENPSLASTTILPLSPQERLTQMRVKAIEQARASNDPEDQEFAEALTEMLATGGRTREEVLAGEVEARNRLTLHQHLSDLASDLDAAGSPLGVLEQGEVDPDRTRLWRNYVAGALGTPQQIEVIDPATKEVWATVDDDVAATLQAEIFQDYLTGQAATEGALQSQASSLAQTVTELGFPLDERMAFQIVSLANRGEWERLNQIAETSGPPGELNGVRAALQVTQGTMQGVGGMHLQWLNALREDSPQLAAYVTHIVGQMQLMDKAGNIPSEEIISAAKELTDKIKRFAEARGIPEEDLPPMVTDPSSLFMLATGGLGGMGVGALVGGTLTASNPVGAGVGAIIGMLGGPMILRELSPGFGVTESDVAPQPTGTQGEQPGRDTLQSLLQQIEGTEAGGPGAQEGPQTRAELLAEITRDIRAGELNLPDARRFHDLTPAEVRMIARQIRGGGQ